MKVRFGLVMAVFLIVLSGFSEPPLTFCDLLKDPGKYNGKEVTLRATWTKGYEWSALYCLDCPDKASVYLDVSSELDDESKRFVRQVPLYATANLTVQGVFMSGGHYGHKGQSQYQVVARRVSNVAIIWKGQPFTPEEVEAVKRWGCGGANPK